MLTKKSGKGIPSVSKYLVDMSGSDPTPPSSGELKRTATSPPDTSTGINAAKNPIKASKFFRKDLAGASLAGASVPVESTGPVEFNFINTAESNDGDAEENLDDNFASPLSSPSKLSIKEQIMKALSGQEFLEKMSMVVTDCVVNSMSSYEPKIQEFDDKIGHLIASVEILQSELNNLKSKSGPHAVSGIITTLVSDVKILKEHMTAKDDLISSLNKRVEHLEAYSRRNAVRISNIPVDETPGNDPEWMVNFAEKNLGVQLNIHEIGRMHRTGPSSPTRPRDILIKFIGYLSRAKVYSKKSYLHSSTNPHHRKDVFINEHLTPQRSSLFYLARAGVKGRKLSASWTHDGAVITKVLPDKDSPTKKWLHNKELITYLAGLPILPEPIPIPTGDTDVTSVMGT